MSSFFLAFPGIASFGLRAQAHFLSSWKPFKEPDRYHCASEPHIKQKLSNKMATHQISKHTMNLKREEFSTSVLLKNILKGTLTVKTDFHSKAFLVQLFNKKKKSSFPSLLPLLKKDHRQYFKRIFYYTSQILFLKQYFANLKNKIFKYSRKTSQYISVHIYLK